MKKATYTIRSPSMKNLRTQRNLQLKDAMESTSVEGEFYDKRKNISPGISRFNRKRWIREMNAQHQDILVIQKSAISIVSIAQNREAILEGIATESLESRTQKIINFY